MKKKPLLLATHNAGKLKEMQALLKNSPFDIISLAQQEKSLKVEEDQPTFYQNAFKKAKKYSQFYQMPVIAEDSGLIVPALNGEPGVYSARFAKNGASDEENNQHLLFKMQNIQDRHAFFECVMVYFESPLVFVTGRGVFDGEILFAPKGNQGFGYDPLFYIPAYKKTIAQLLVKEKNQISHRFKALEDLFKNMKTQGIL